MSSPGSAAVPVVDLSLPEQDAAEAVREACTSVGFFYIEHHGVPIQMVEDAFAQFRAAFSQPLEVKLEIAADSNNRGYTCYQEETLDPSTQVEGDTKEGYYFGREVPADSPEASKPLHGPNQWPSADRLPSFRPAVTTYFDALHGLSNRLLRLLALALRLPADHFAPLFAPPMIMLRPLHYAARKSCPEEGILGAGAHSDYGMLTVLATDGQRGLQISVDGVWVDVPPREGCFIINLGDMLERWTNGLFRSTLHRVVTGDQERYSCAFFFEPCFDTVVECLPSCCSEERPARYAPTTAGQHLLDKYAATHAGYTGPTHVDGAKAGAPALAMA